MYWKVCTRCAYKSLSTSEQFWQCTNQKIDQHRSKPSYQKVKTMVRRHIDQMIRTRNIKVRNERIETGVLFKTQTGKNVSVEERIGGCCQWKAKGQCSKGDACSFRHKDSRRGKAAQSSSPTPRPQTQNDGRRPSKGNASLQAVVHQEGEIKNRTKLISRGICTYALCQYWRPHVCQNFKSASGCEFRDKCLFRHTEVDSQPRKNSRRKSQNIWVAYSKIQSRNRGRFYGRAQNLWDQIAACASQKARYTRVHRKELLRSAELKNAIVRPNSRMEHRKKPCNKNDSPSEKHGIWRKMSTSSMTRTRPCSSHLQKFGHYGHHLRRNLRRELAVDSGASMRTLSRKDLNLAKLETVRVSRNLTAVTTANGEVQTSEEAEVFVHNLDLFVTVQILGTTPAVL